MTKVIYSPSPKTSKLALRMKKRKSLRVFESLRPGLVDLQGQALRKQKMRFMIT